MYLSIIQCVYIYIYLFIKKGCDQRPPPALAATATWSGPMAPKRLNLPGFSVNVPNVPASTDCLIKFCKVVARTWGEVHELSWPQRRFKRRKCKPWGLGRIFFIVFIHPLIPSDSMWFLHLDIVEICRHRNQRVYESGILHCLSTNCRQSWLGSVICSLFPGCLGLIL